MIHDAGYRMHDQKIRNPKIPPSPYSFELLRIPICHPLPMEERGTIR